MRQDSSCEDVLDLDSWSGVARGSTWPPACHGSNSNATRPQQNAEPGDLFFF